MPTLLVVGGGLFGSLAASYARHRGLEAVVFDSHRPGAASPAAGGLFKEEWAGRKLAAHFAAALPVLDQLHGLRRVTLSHEDGTAEPFFCVPPSVICEPHPVRETVTAVGDGWLEAGGRRYEGWVYVAAGVWSGMFCPGLGVTAKSGASFVFDGESPARIRVIERSRQAVAFAREPGTTFFSDGTAESGYTVDHDRISLARAADLGLPGPPLRRLWGARPYTPGGPVFRRLGKRTWLATGGRKMGTILGAAFARRLADELG